ncbi:hypothetical protein M1D52_02275 [Olivibacter sp. SA151]|uniref:hypothetical protein n=1 Tax=Olivibacter jilunii TaxID=985016 RepID=UPI003F17D0F0
MQHISVLVVGFSRRYLLEKASPGKDGRKQAIKVKELLPKAFGKKSVFWTNTDRRPYREYPVLIILNRVLKTMAKFPYFSVIVIYMFSPIHKAIHLKNAIALCLVKWTDQVVWHSLQQV